MIKHITPNEYEQEVINCNGKVLVDFFATWCGPCQMLSQVLEKISEEDNSTKIVKVNVDEATELAMKNDVEVVPTMILYNNGEIVDRVEGYMDKEELKKLISR